MRAEPLALEGDEVRTRDRLDALLGGTAPVGMVAVERARKGAVAGPVRSRTTVFEYWKRTWMRCFQKMVLLPCLGEGAFRTITGLPYRSAGSKPWPRGVCC
jgi:hypothetical protein